MADERNIPSDEPSATPGGEPRDESVGQSGLPSEPLEYPAVAPSHAEREELEDRGLKPGQPEVAGGTEAGSGPDSPDSIAQPQPDFHEMKPEPPVEQPVGKATPSEQTTENKSRGKRREAESGEPESDEAEKPTLEKSQNMDWYILKVQSNREDSIRDGLLRRVAIAGLDYFFGDVIVPTEKVTEFKGGKKRITRRKLYPGYIVVNMEINDDTWFLVRDTPGIGDFTGAAGTPTPMLPHEVNRILSRQEEKTDETPKLKINFAVGDRVKINEGTFENFEGEVDSIDETNGRVTVMINIFGRSTPVELEYWQIEAI